MFDKLDAIEEKYEELSGQLGWLHDGPVAVDVELLTRRGLPAPDAAALLATLADAMAGLAPFEPAAVEQLIDRVGAEAGANRKRVFMSIRVAVVGGPVSPPLHETLAALGRERSVARLRAASDLLG